MYQEQWDIVEAFATELARMVGDREDNRSRACRVMAEQWADLRARLHEVAREMVEEECP